MDLLNARPRKKKTPPDVLPSATLSEFDGVRYLHLGDTPWVQGAMRIRKPQTLELDYVQRMMAWLLLKPTAAWAQGHVVQLGLGAAALTRFSHSVLRWRSTAVELNPQVVAACRQWFHLPPNDERLNVVVADARAWVEDTLNWDSADVLQVDLYDHDAAGPVLDDEDFYRACHAVLTEGGVMAVNLFGRSAKFMKSARRIEAVFGVGQVWKISPTAEGNAIVLAGKGVDWPERDELQRRAEAVRERFQLPAPPWVRLMRVLPTPRAVVAVDDAEELMT
ncbi:spermidine synthase [Leptothrix ochracea L12]|uniref:Spermidine synthase n=1 Tax=Leptothrix ochracea L12 TaxID=735332 RepID=I4Z575_9BURK|nr:spermidine synthase [Leptothrix ochracea]EIM31367.1 spermidine synthase [Leptothrix ochracea L12]